MQPHVAYQCLYPFFFPIKVASDGYRRGYVSFAHFLLYLYNVVKNLETLFTQNDILFQVMEDFYSKINDPSLGGAIFVAVCRGKVGVIIFR